MIAVVIPAKADSGRLANKNTLQIFGTSLLDRAIDFAKGISLADKIVVSTDCCEIATHAQARGVDVVIRGANLCGDAPLLEVYRHAYKQLGNEHITHVVGVQPDNPDRTIDADRAIRYVLENDIDEFFTTDRNGRKNGSLRIMSLKTLFADAPLSCSSAVDPCTNIHMESDLRAAKVNLMNCNKKIVVAGKVIGQDAPVFVIAEAACNHMCDMQLAREMIDKAADAGANSIKFQTYTTEKLATKQSGIYGNIKTRSQYEYYKQFDKFGKEQYRQLFQYAEEKGIVAFSTPFDPENAHMLGELGMPIFKIASCDLLYTDLLTTVAGFGRPVILSTGGAELNEVTEALVALYEAGARDIILMACTLAYPTSADDANYAKILSLRDSFPNVLIGMSDHVEPDEYMVCGAVYVAMGARIVEKHYTLDRSMSGGGHSFSMEPADLKKWVQNIRFTERVIGQRQFKAYSAEFAARQNARRSLVFNVPLKGGTVLEHSMIGVKRPGTGIMPNQAGSVVGKALVCDVEPDTQISWDVLKNTGQEGPM
jgi:N-acetylneuraminate synthase